MGIIKQEIKVIGEKAEDKDLAVVDNGTDRTMIKESLLNRIGAKYVGKVDVVLREEVKTKKNVYVVDLELGKCKIPKIVVIGGNANLIGRDILQITDAKLDFKNDKVDFPNYPIEIRI